MEAFRKYTLDQLVELMVRHLRDDFPGECEKKALKKELAAVR